MHGTNASLILCVVPAPESVHDVVRVPSGNVEIPGEIASQADFTLVTEDCFQHRRTIPRSRLDVRSTGADRQGQGESRLARAQSTSALALTHMHDSNTSPKALDGANVYPGCNRAHDECA